MALDKAKHQGQSAKGRAKETVGAATGNTRLKTKGKDDQRKAKAKEAGRHAKNAGKNVDNALKP